jgi:queuine tRNA-ribosyltransferase subunit QTRTD1
MQRSVKIEFDKQNSFQSPFYAIYTKGGVVPNLTIDILEDILQGPHAFSVNFFDLYASDDVIAAYQLKTKKTLKDFLSMQAHSFLIDCKDSFSQSTHSKCTESTLYGETCGGVKKVLFPDYFKCIQRYNFEFFTSLYDTSSVKDKNITFHNLTKKAMETNQNCKIIVPFVGGKNRPIKDRFTEFVKSIDSTSKAILFRELGDSPKETFAFLEHAVPILEKQQIMIPRILDGSDHPKMVLQSISRGIDIFTGKFPFVSAEFGYAIIFPLDLVDNEVPLHLNLRDLKYEVSGDPLVKGCKCLTCRDHTRAYIHHLLNTKEMTGDVLLSMYDDPLN